MRINSPLLGRGLGGGLYGRMFKFTSLTRVYLSAEGPARRQTGVVEIGYNHMFKLKVSSKIKWCRNRSRGELNPGILRAAVQHPNDTKKATSLGLELDGPPPGPLPRRGSYRKSTLLTLYNNYYFF